MLSVKERYIVAFGAARIDDDIKGLSYLLDALRILISERGYKSSDIRLLLFGGIKDESKLNEIPVEYTYFGYVNDHSRMSQIYSAANVVVSSSLYETFGQTLIEAQLCGCIPVAFNNSGQSDIIHHKEDGYLADGLEWAFNARIEPRDQKKGVVRRYAESVVAAQYIHLYQDISKKSI
jgi:glycosyltransferase involved in cell wall biosynthesis